MSFSENLQFIRAQAGVTQEQLAEQLDVTRQSVSKWESAASFPEMDTLLRICDLYSVNLDTLLRGSVEESQVSDTARYDTFMNRFAWRISVSVAAILLGLGLAAVLEGLKLSELWSGLVMLLFICVPTVVLVATSIQYENFRKNHPIIADFYTQEQKHAFQQKFVWYIAGGVGAILFGMALVLLMGYTLGEAEPWDSWTGALFLFIVAGAVWSFIYGGIQHDKYDIGKYNWTNAPTPEARRRTALIGTVCGVIMLLAAAVYVGLGFALGLWQTVWWVFPVAGILCGVVSIVLSPYKGDE